MTQHLHTGRTRTGNTDTQYHTACGRWVGPESATSWQQTDCAACRRSLAWWKASEQ